MQGISDGDWDCLINHPTLNAKRFETADKKLRDLFAQVLLNDKDYFEDTSKTPKYCFDPLRDEDFDFPTRGADKIDSVSVVRVVARSAHSDVKRVIMELKPGLSIVGLGMVVEEHGLDLTTDVIDGVRLQFTFEGKGRSKYRTVSLFNPNSCNLNDTERDRVIRRCLKDWGILDASIQPALGVAAVATAAQ